MRFVSISAALSLSLFLLVVSGRAADENKADPQEKLETAIPYGIRLLEEKEYAKFLQKFVEPEQFKKITANTPLDEFAKGFAERKAPVLLKVLKAVKDLKPTLDDEGKVATYEIKDKDQTEGRTSITFQKTEKLWYIKN
jgi:hypothetical protein